MTFEISILSLRTFGEDICKPPPIQSDQKVASASTDPTPASTDPTPAEKEAQKMEDLVAGDAEGEGKPGVALATEGGEEAA